MASLLGVQRAPADDAAARTGTTTTDPAHENETSSSDAETAAESFDVNGESHRLWVTQMGGETVLMVASDPMTVPQRLRSWTKQANKMPPSTLRTNLLETIDKCWTKSSAVLKAATIANPKQRLEATQKATIELRQMIQRLFFVFDKFELGAVAVYRGIHFTTDWDNKRGRTVAAEAGRDLASLQAEGTFSAAVWELAARFAQPAPPTRRHLESATRVVQEVLATWRTTTDFTRVDSSLPAQLAQALANPNIAAAQAAHLSGLLEATKTRFTHKLTTFEHQFAAALSRYIDNQKLFETEIQTKTAAYRDVPFGQIPFVSTTKAALEAVKYAQGKLAQADVKNTAGVVGRVLVYVAEKADFIAAGGVDVWHELTEGRLRFTEWRMAEQEITFSGMVPDHFLKAMTPVHPADPAPDADAAEIAAATAAAPYGGLLQLPTNQPIR